MTHPIILVMTGGAIGSALRYQMGVAALRWLGPAFPWGTFLVNLIGGLAMGALAGAILGQQDRALWYFMGVGVLGGFTTFSAFSLDLFSMLQRGQFAAAAAYAIASAAGSVMFLIIGWWAARSLAA